MEWKDFVDKVATFEGCPNKNGICYAYKDAGGTLTIGYGFTDSDYTRRKDMTVNEAKEVLNKKLTLLYSTVKKTCESWGYPFNVNQLLALTDFTFNLGTGNLKKLTADGTRNAMTISAKISEYCKCNGVVLAGLVNRRRWETTLFNTQTTEVSNIEQKDFVNKAESLQQHLNYLIEIYNIDLKPLYIDGIIGRKTIEAVYTIFEHFNSKHIILT